MRRRFIRMGSGCAIALVAVSLVAIDLVVIATPRAQSVNPTGRVGIVPPALPAPAGQPFSLQGGPATSLGGNGGLNTLVMPGGGIATARPNANGTTTITHTDGRTEVVNTPR